MENFICSVIIFLVSFISHGVVYKIGNNKGKSVAYKEAGDMADEYFANLKLLLRGDDEQTIN